MAGFTRNRCRIARELVDQVTLLGGGALQSRPIPTCEQRLLCSAQPLAGRNQPLDVPRPAACELVQCPPGGVRFAKSLDGIRLLAEPVAPEALGELVPSTGEVLQREPVQLVCRLVDHARIPAIVIAGGPAESDLQSYYSAFDRRK